MTPELRNKIDKIRKELEGNPKSNSPKEVTINLFPGDSNEQKIIVKLFNPLYYSYYGSNELVLSDYDIDMGLSTNLQ